MIQRRGHGLASGGVPNAGSVIEAGSGDVPSIRREAGFKNQDVMLQWRTDLHPCIRVPKTGGRVIAHGEDGLAIRAKGSAVDDAVMRHGRPDRLTGWHLPRLSHAVLPSGHHP